MALNSTRQRKREPPNCGGNHTSMAARLEAVLAEAEVDDALSPLPDSARGARVVCRVEMGEIEYTLLRRRKRNEHPDAVNLSPREREILRLIANGRSNQSIARILDISQWTVSTHLRRIYAKLRVHTRAEAVALVLRAGELEGHRTDAPKARSAAPSSAAAENETPAP